MKTLTALFTVLLAVSAFAFGDDGNNNPGFIASPTIESETRGSADLTITATSINSFTCSYASNILGLDYHMAIEALLFSCATDDKNYLCNPDTGAEITSLDYPWTNPGAFCGVMVYTSPYTFYFDDWSDSDIHVFTAGTWSTETNPVGTNGRGMDFDGTNTWITNGSTGVCRFQPGVGHFYNLDEPTAQLSGLTTFPYNANLGVMVTSYSDHNFYFYEFDGSTMIYLGSTPVPVTCSYSFGLTYSASRDSFFWSYQDAGSTYHIDELSITFTESAVEETTWGQIKTM